MTTTRTLRFVTYLNPDVLERVPPSLVADWPAEESCTPVREMLAEIEDPDEADALVAEVRDLVSEAATLVQREVLPEGDILDATYLGLGGSYQLVGRSPVGKVRLDQDFNVCVLRRVPLEIDEDKPRLLALRAELLEVLCGPFSTPDKLPLKARRVVDLKDDAACAIYAELEAPAGSGFANGRFEAVRVYSDGKVLLLGFQPTGLVEDAFSPPGPPGTADPSDPRFELDNDPEIPPGPAPRAPAPPPKPGEEGWTEEDDERVAANRAQQAALGGPPAAPAAGAPGAADAADGADGADGEASPAGAAGAEEPETAPAPAEPPPPKKEMTPLERARARRARKKAEKDGQAAGAPAGDAAGKGGAAKAGADGETTEDKGGASAGPDTPPLRLDEQGELQDDGVDVDAWDRGELD